MNRELFLNQLQSGVSLVDFYASGSEPCTVQQDIIDRLSTMHEGKASFMIINVDEHRDLARSFGITSIPTLIVFKNGNEFERLIGLQNMEVLSKALEKASA